MSKITLKTRIEGENNVMSEDFTKYRNVSGTLLTVPQSASQDDLNAMGELTVQYFNRTRYPHEKPRVFVGVEREAEVISIYEEEEYVVPGTVASIHDESTIE